LEKFIPRTIKRGASSYSVDDFLKIVKDDSIVAVADVGGGGKTTLLTEVYEKLTEPHSTHWVSFVTLFDFRNDFFNDVDENFVNFMIKLLKLKALDREIFIKMFEKGKVKIFFDGYDELPKKCAKNALKLFELFKSCDTKNQIWITTRKNLVKELEGSLNVEVHKIQEIDENEQIKLVKFVWESSSESESIKQSCAIKLVEKLNDHKRLQESMAGVPFILEGLAKKFEKDIGINFEVKIEGKFSNVFSEVSSKSTDKIVNMQNKECNCKCCQKRNPNFKF
jgi:hypothetical protein